MNIIYENQIIPEKFSSLTKEILHNNDLQKYFQATFEGIKPNNYCGYLSIKNESYFIAPKIASKDATNLNIFIYMLVYAYDIKLSNEDIASFTNNQHRIFEIFIKFFSDKLLDELKKGIFKKYITLEENLKVLRGKYVIEKNFTNFYHQNIYCEYDEFSMDNELNRFFIYAIKVFKKFSSYQNLSRCELILDEVEYSNIDFSRLKIYFDRMNSRYKYCYELALMILQKLIPMPSSNSQKSFAFLFDMAEVFEKFIGKIYQNIDPSTKVQHPKNFGNLQLKPDIMTDAMIVDTKYKVISNRDDLSTGDKYQMFAYGTNFGIKDTMLLYPKHFNKDFHNEDLKLGLDEKEVSLKMRCVDLVCEDVGYEGYIEKIIERLNSC
jgi:5-methylcytosine-specific restriction enzyme subunit McrC